VSGRVRRLAAPWRLELGGQAQLVAAAVAAAWVASVGLWLASVGLSLTRAGTPGGSGGASASVWWCMPGMGAGGVIAGSASGGAAAAIPAAAGAAAALPMWLLMSLTMALPGELPAVQYVATNTLRRTRSSAVGEFVAVYLLIWLAGGLPAALLIALLHHLPTDALFATALAAAAAYELTPLKRRALGRCHRGAPLSPAGPRRVADVARFGWLNASGCVASCWPAMLAASFAPVAQPLAIGGFTCAMTYERLTRRPRTAQRRIAAGYLAVAAVFVAAALQ
jgi:predicted metal-binding membrane protein